MKRMILKAAALALTFVMVLTMFSACGSNANATTDEIVDAAVKAALEASVVPTVVTIEADGKQITIEDAAGKSAQQLLAMASITLNDGDLLTLAPDQALTGNVTIQVLRKHTVSVVVDQTSVQYTAVLMGGTVADAIAAFGIELADNQITNYELDAALEDGMEIIISEMVVEEETEPTEPEAESDNSSSSSSSSSSGSSSGSSSSSSSSSGSSSGSSSSTTPTTPPATTPTTPPTTEPTAPPTTAPTEPERYVVSVEVYEDCDGSGHGVKVITYSDGTQEEVYF